MAIAEWMEQHPEAQWDFLHALERYAKERGARLVVIPMRYANPTSKRDPQEEKDEDYWATSAPLSPPSR